MGITIGGNADGWRRPGDARDAAKSDAGDAEALLAADLRSECGKEGRGKNILSNKSLM